MSRYINQIPLSFPDYKTDQCGSALLGLINAIMESLGDDYEIDDIVPSSDEEVALKDHVYKIHPKDKSYGFLFKTISTSAGGTIRIYLYNNMSDNLQEISLGDWASLVYLCHMCTEAGDHVFGISMVGSNNVYSIFYNFGFVTTTDDDIHVIHRKESIDYIVYSNDDQMLNIPHTRSIVTNSMTQISKYYCIMTGQQYNNLWRIDACPETFGWNSFLRYNNLLFHPIGTFNGTMSSYQNYFALLLQIPSE